MKKTRTLYLIIFIIFVQNAYSQRVQVWKKCDLPPGFSNNVYLDIQFSKTNPNLGWACGYQSKVLRTTDGGETWIGTQLQYNLQLESIHFPTDQVGYLVGISDQGGIIWKSNDGGISWDLLNLPANIFRVSLWGHHFYDEDNGLVLGGACGPSAVVGNQVFPRGETIYKTTNGGNSWSAVTGEIDNTKFSDPLMLDPNGECWAISSGLLWRSLDGGTTWEVFSETGGYDWHEEISKFGNSFLIPYSVGCDGGDIFSDGGLRFSTDGGLTWKDESLRNSFYGTFLENETEGWGVGANQSIYYTSDAGQNWELRNTCIEDGDHLDDIWVVNDTTVWVAGDGIYYMDFVETEGQSRNDTIISCSQEPVYLIADEGYDFYQWSNGSYGRQIELNSEDDIDISVNMILDNCLNTTDTINYHVIINDPVDFTTGTNPNRPLCEGENQVLFLQGEFDQINWVDEEDNLISTSKSITVTESALYRVVAVDSNLCEYEIPFDVFFNPNPEPEITPLTELNVCIGETVILDGGEQFEYNWLKSPLSSVYATGKQLEISESGTYTLQAISEFGCVGFSEPVEVIIRPDSNYFDFTINYTGEPADFGINDFNKTKCSVLELSNNSSWRTAVLDNPYLIENKYFSIPSAQLPIIIPPLETAELIICFEADSIGLNIDSLLIPDLCSDHAIPVKGLVKAVDYESNSRCELNISIHQLDADVDFYSTYSNPYPNPASDEVRLDFIHYTPNTWLKEVSAVLMDMNGNEVANGTFNVENNEVTQNGLIEYGHILFDLTNVSAGSYLIVIQDPDKTFTANVMVIK